MNLFFQPLYQELVVVALLRQLWQLFLESTPEIKEKERINRAKALYFRQLNDQLTMIIERLLLL